MQSGKSLDILTLMSEPGAVEFITSEQAQSTPSDGFLSKMKERIQAAGQVLVSPESSTFLAGFLSVDSQYQIPNPNIQTVLTLAITGAELMKNRSTITEMTDDFLTKLRGNAGTGNHFLLTTGAADVVVNYALSPTAQIISAAALAELQIAKETGTLDVSRLKNILPHNRQKAEAVQETSTE